MRTSALPGVVEGCADCRRRAGLGSSLKARAPTVELIRRRDAEVAAALGAWLDELATAHADRILPVDGAVAEEWGRLNVPDPIPVVDGLIAATARVHGLRLATRNLADVERTGVDCLDPFD